MNRKTIAIAVDVCKQYGIVFFRAHRILFKLFHFLFAFSFVHNSNELNPKKNSNQNPPAEHFAGRKENDFGLFIGLLFKLLLMNVQVLKRRFFFFNNVNLIILNETKQNLICA